MKLLSHVATFAAAVAVGLLMLASPTKANTITEPSVVGCGFCEGSMGQSLAPMSGPFSKMIDSRFSFDGDNQDGNSQGGPNFFTGGDIVRIKFAENSDEDDDAPADAPEPSTLLLLATGLTGLAFLVRKTA